MIGKEVLRAAAFMACGCSSNAEKVLASGERVPACVVHGETRTMAEPRLFGRRAKCFYGCDGSVVPSSMELVFFEYKPWREYDGYFCGCRGYD